MKIKLQFKLNEYKSSGTSHFNKVLVTFTKVCEFTKSGELDSNVIQILWERFAMKIPNTTASESRGAVILLSMAAG